MNKTAISLTSFSLAFIFSLFLPSLVSAKNSEDSKLIPGNYIVVFKDEVASPEENADDMSKKYGFNVNFTYSHALKGFSANIPQAKLSKVKEDSRVDFVSQDREVGLVTSAQSKGTIGTPIQPPQLIPNGVKRIGQNISNKGTGIGVAVIDTGIDLNHPDLMANIGGNYSCIKGRRTGEDDNGHGTHVAGTIAGINNSIGVVGVAPEARLFAVKVLNAQGSGTWSSVICGINWVTSQAQSRNIKVANMSLGSVGQSDNNCGRTNNDALHQAICRSRDAGVTYIVAAGNESDNASKHVPAAYDDTVITVSALVDTDGTSGGSGASSSYGADDTFASFSNFGTGVDLGAPGVSIRSTWINDGYNTISGTSMASPHVAGAAALYIKTNPLASWSSVRSGLVSSGEILNSGHTDPLGLHPENIVRTSIL